MDAIWNKGSQAGATRWRENKPFYFGASTCLEFGPGFGFDLCSAWLLDTFCFVLSFLGSDRVSAPGRGSFFGTSCHLLGCIGVWKFGHRTAPGLFITLVSYMDGTGLGTIMVRVWFLSDCSSLLLLIIQLQNLSTGLYGWIIIFPFVFLPLGHDEYTNGSMVHDHRRPNQTRGFVGKGVVQVYLCLRYCWSSRVLAALTSRPNLHIRG